MYLLMFDARKITRIEEEEEGIHYFSFDLWLNDLFHNQIKPLNCPLMFCGAWLCLSHPELYVPTHYRLDPACVYWSFECDVSAEL